MSDRLLTTAAEIADDVLFPNALAADRASHVPTMQLDALGAAGLYGVSIEQDGATVVRLLEVLASGCLTTAFVFAQHLGATRAAADSSRPVRSELAGGLASGTLRGGVAFAHLLRPGEPLTAAQPTADGWRYTGVAPWVTGWGYIDVLHAGARHDDTIVWALVDATESATLRGELLDLAAVNASRTVVAHFDGHYVPDSRVTRIDDYATWRSNYQLGLRANGSLPLGVATRCCRLLGESPLDAELEAVRLRLDAIPPTQIGEMSAARAEASLFAVRAATALVATTGGRSVTMAEHAQRLMREAMFLLVQGQTPMIKSEMLTRLGAAGG